MTEQDPRPVPDLSNYGTGMGPEYEWLISDHPWARAERLRRAADYYAETELDDEGFPGHEPSQGETTPDVHQEEDLSGIPAELGETVGGLVEHVDPNADRNQVLYAVADTEPDEVAVVRYRQEYERYRRGSGEPDYRYPEHYVGASAAQYPPPGHPVSAPQEANGV